MSISILKNPNLYIIYYNYGSNMSEPEIEPDNVMQTNLKIFAVIFSVVVAAMAITYYSNTKPSTPPLPIEIPVIIYYLKNFVILLFIILLLTVANLFYLHKISSNLNEIAKSIVEGPVK